jgi:hypothetical protein
MVHDLLAIFLTIAGIAVIVTLFRQRLRRPAMGSIGLLFVLEPLAINTYRTMDPWLLLAFSHVGVLILMWATVPQ